MDLVERLRNYYSEDAQSYCTTHTICDEAADEIERLRNELAKCGKDNCMGRLTPGTTTWVTWEAREEAVAAERERCKALAVQVVEWHRNDYNRQQIDPIVAALRNGL